MKPCGEGGRVASLWSRALFSGRYDNCRAERPQEKVVQLRTQVRELKDVAEAQTGEIRTLRPSPPAGEPAGVAK